MKCSKCQRDKRMDQLNFKELGTRVLGSIPEYEAVCDSCVKKPKEDEQEFPF